VLAQALRTLQTEGLRVVSASRVISSDPVGPSIRRYVNAAAVVETSLAPPELLGLLKRVERQFGRRAGGQRWTARVLDLDIVLWSGGSYADPQLTVPHRLFRERPFVLTPAMEIAADWRDPVTGLTLRQLHARLTRPRLLRR
jgi:2-amino-4-hydroxy-6-hydroxymethyldihydropteridine diphosphokinase